ncbi:hypothetical protein [Streptomyces sp. FH025]|uniref:hypothetical protein n=1 Tax=Streptomyces sp. FH025 TaxID=2815937 RepID=UPI001A9FF6BF|nr:hypothetical protein [Streptomyces sp. FH025]MBO1416697.1 hypothetical protein [Streptomyces sp. FH025]
MGIFDRLFHRPPHEHTGQEAAERAALAHDETVDAYSNDVERKRETQERLAQEEADRRAAEDMTAEGDPWG